MTWEYTAVSCDVWQAHFLANRWQHAYGWEAVSVTNLPARHLIPSVLGDDTSELIPAAVAPVQVLFRRPVREEAA